ncbi:MAG: hypothetical protein M1511_17245 [Deltaproteobacteria bacterium]|nr:hypothetical protein [Deltaproteobacteria bacterium]
MTQEILNLIIRSMILMFAGASSEIALAKRIYSLALFMLALWVMTFRLALMRAAAAYMGVFGHQTQSFVSGTLDLLRSPGLSNITDAFLLVTLVFVFIWLGKQKNQINK